MKLWETLRHRRPGFTCAKLFWWYNMYSSANWSVTPRPVYPADGRKIPALFSHPAGLHPDLELKLGPFPFFDFCGPKAGIASSAWIASWAAEVFERERPDLSLAYLRHLDYNLQRLGPQDLNISRDITDIDRVAGELIERVRASGAEVMGCSPKWRNLLRSSVLRGLVRNAPAVTRCRV